MTALTLPGTIPGLLRRGSPVTCASPDTTRRRGVVVEVGPGESYAVVALESDPAHDASLEWLPLADLCLELDDRTGQQHAGLYLWEHPTPPGVDYSGLIRGAGVGRADVVRLGAAVMHVAGVAS